VKYKIRKSLHLLLALCIYALPVAAHAQNPDLFDRQQTAPPTELEELLGEVPEEGTTQEVPTSVEEFANQYYSNCLRQDHPNLEGKSLEVLCACTAAKFPEEMTLEQTLEMQRRTNNGKLQRLRFMEFIYSPCIRFPTAEIVQTQCLEDEEIRRKYRNEKAICACTAEKMGDFMNRKAPGYVDLAVRRNLDNIDPLKLLLGSKQFDRQTAYEMRYCVDRYEYGKK